MRYLSEKLFSSPAPDSKILLPLIGILLLLLAVTGTARAAQPVLDEAGRDPGRSEYRNTGMSGEASMIRVDINTASVEELAEVLPGIGPQKAQRIVAWREANGAFESVDQLLEISGIGPKTLERIRPYIRIGDALAARRMQQESTLQEAQIRQQVQNIVATAVQDAQLAHLEFGVSRPRTHTAHAQEHPGLQYAHALSVQAGQ